MYVRTYVRYSKNRNINASSFDYIIIIALMCECSYCISYLCGTTSSLAWALCGMKSTGVLRTAVTSAVQRRYSYLINSLPTAVSLPPGEWLPSFFLLHAGLLRDFSTQSTGKSRGASRWPYMTDLLPVADTMKIRKNDSREQKLKEKNWSFSFHSYGPYTKFWNFPFSNILEFH